jgi:hypothetical protein
MSFFGIEKTHTVIFLSRKMLIIPENAQKKELCDFFQIKKNSHTPARHSAQAHTFTSAGQSF